MKELASRLKRKTKKRREGDGISVIGAGRTGTMNGNEIPLSRQAEERERENMTRGRLSQVTLTIC